MTDLELARAFERGDVSNADFHHESHLRVAWVYLNESTSLADAKDRMAAALRRFAASAGKAEKYHHTLTVFWVAVLADARRAIRGFPVADTVAFFHEIGVPLHEEPGEKLFPNSNNARDVLRAYPELLDKDLALAFYSRDRLFSDAARLGWVAPDRQPLGEDAAQSRPAHTSGDSSDRPLSVRSA